LDRAAILYAIIVTTRTSHPSKRQTFPGASFLPLSPAMSHEFYRIFDRSTYYADKFDPTRDGMRVLEIQRRHLPDWPASVNHHVVGGFAQLTTITENSIETKIIHRWPDEVGQPIRPCRGIGDRNHVNRARYGLNQ